MESNLKFQTHLHNCDPLTRRTRQVPAGRRAVGEPPFDWDVSASRRSG
jgi:lysozyme family protein